MPHHFYIKQKSPQPIWPRAYFLTGSASGQREPNSSQLHLQQSPREQPITKALALLSPQLFRPRRTNERNCHLFSPGRGGFFGTPAHSESRFKAPGLPHYLPGENPNWVGGLGAAYLSRAGAVCLNYFRGLPRLANEMPAAFRKRPAFFKVRHGPRDFQSFIRLSIQLTFGRVATHKANGGI